MKAKGLLLIALCLPAGGWGYYATAPIDPLISYESLRGETPRSFRVDGHVSYALADARYDEDGREVGLTEESPLYLGLAKIGYVIDKAFEVDMTLHAARAGVPGGAAESTGVGDIWISAKGGWPTKRLKRLRLGPRVGFRIPVAADVPFTDGNGAADVGCLLYYEVRKWIPVGSEVQVGSRFDLGSDAFAETPGPSFYCQYEPAIILGEGGWWRLGLVLGGYAGLTSAAWIGARGQWEITNDVRLDAGVLSPLGGTSYAEGDYEHNVLAYHTYYIGVQSLIGTRKR